MIIAAMYEKDETRVAITPNVIKAYVKLGFGIIIEQNAGLLSGFKDIDYENAGATIVKNKAQLLKNTDVLVCINEPNLTDLKKLPSNALLICPVDSSTSPCLHQCVEQGISVFSMNHVPRISRAQSIDSLSSQANLAGYRAVIEAVSHFKRAIPMMMTAAGMIHPAKVLVLGAGVAGLQAIATAKRLGAIVYAFDVRAAAKEQVESLNAEFIEVRHTGNNETASGYAKALSTEEQHLQSALIDEYAELADLVICTALIPGKKAPMLLSKNAVEHMKPGSVIVDMATARGGNCEVSVRDKIIQHQDVTVIGYSNMAGLVPATASELFANNIVQLIKLFASTPATLTFNENDDIIQQAMLCHQGKSLPFQTIKEN